MFKSIKLKGQPNKTTHSVQDFIRTELQRGFHAVSVQVAFAVVNSMGGFFLLWHCLHFRQSGALESTCPHNGSSC